MHGKDVNSLCGFSNRFHKLELSRFAVGSQPWQCRLMARWRLTMGVMTLAFGSNASCWSNGSWEECCTGVPRKRCWTGRHQQLLGFGSFFFHAKFSGPVGSMYDIYPYIWLIFMVNVGRYTMFKHV